MALISDFSATLLTGGQQDLAAYHGKVLLIVNTATACGYTPQLGGLEKLHQAYADQGLVILGFPSNEFGGQEPRDGAEIGEFCERNYGVTFPIFEKVEVNGEDAHPLFKWLRTEKRGLLGEKIRWNFTKFLVGRDGQPIKRYGTNTTPAALAKDIEKALAR